MSKLLNTTLLLVAVIGIVNTSAGLTPLNSTPATSQENVNDEQPTKPHPKQAFDWPSGHPVKILREFSIGQFNWNPGHRGVDLDLEAGAPVYAPADGIIRYAGPLNDRQVISLEHQDGIRTTFEPVIPMVIKGQHVRRHDVIGTVDGTHCAPRSCLHWGAKRGKDRYINPLSLLEGPIVLLD
ncbi:M23 family metallopeptidase [Arcanobacterium buesumense]|uniref:M23 family metallopeptidase n=1 Tax=Arcanobacterium buesumense TaxID=2722751 RepID=A0A6H2EK69_9ACTO|nr:M23 family metallopeptidase [Arcanobacterium buesumense]QJC21554.1 M23 family metallopeptidase [Arcanobacterium buesumense]